MYGHTRPCILMASLFFQPIPGGAERHAQKLAKELVRRGCKVVYATAHMLNLKRSETIDGFEVYRLPCFPWIPRIRRYIAVNIYIAALLWFIWSKRREVDILHSHGAFDVSSVATVIAGKLLDKKSIVKYASLTEYQRIRKFFPGSLFERVVRCADYNVANSQIVYRKMIEDYGLPPARCGFIPNGVEIPEPPFSLSDARRVLGLRIADRIAVCVANFYPRKNQATVIRSWPRVVKRIPDCHLILVGSGPEMAGCQELAADLGVDHLVHFVGAVNDVESYLRAANLFVFPSLSESLSNAVLEAMAQGLPCVASNIPGNEAIIEDGRNGVLFHPHDPSDLANKIIGLLTDSHKANLLGIQARQTMIEQFSISRIADSYLKLYEHLMQN